MRKQGFHNMIGDPLRFLTDPNYGKDYVVTIAKEGESFTAPGSPKTVIYQSITDPSKQITKVVTGSGICSNDFFGGDPHWGTEKRCYFQPSAADPVAQPLPQATASVVTANQPIRPTNSFASTTSSGTTVSDVISPTVDQLRPKAGIGTWGWVGIIGAGVAIIGIGIYMAVK